MVDELAEWTLEEFEPLELIYSDETLRLVAKTGSNGDQTMLGSFKIDFEKITCELVLQN